VLLYGVVNVSPDSLHAASIAATPDAAVERGRALLADGADALDVGGQASTDIATVVDWQVEWDRVAAVIPVLVGLGVDVSIDSWRPEVVRHALDAGATVINAADGMQQPAMWEVAADHDVPIVVPFLSGPDPRRMTIVTADPVATIIEFFERRLAEADRYGLRDRCILDPGTGFAPPGWPWEERYRYQKRVYTHLDELRVFDLPLYVALPWKETVQHDELLEIVVRAQPEFARAHEPAKVRRVERRVASHDGSGPLG